MSAQHTPGPWHLETAIQRITELPPEVIASAITTTCIAIELEKLEKENAA